MSVGRGHFRWCVPLVMAVGCGAIIDDVDDYSFDGSASGSGAVGAGAASDGGSGGAGTQSGPGGGGATTGTGGGCAPPAWSGEAPEDIGTLPICASYDSDDPDVPKPAGTFGGCDDCQLVDLTTDDVSFDEGWAPFCALLRGDDPLGDIVIDSGKARIQTSCSSWFGADYGPFLYRRIHFDDFVVVTHVDAKDNGGVPFENGHGGGLLLRKANATPGGEAAEKYVRFSAAYDGMTSFSVGLFLWHHDTSLGADEKYFEEVGQGSADLALCRKDGHIQSWYRVTPGEWTHLDHDQATGAALSGEVQVGLEAHAYLGEARVTADFTGIHFGPAKSTSCLDAITTTSAKMAAAQK